MRTVARRLTYRRMSRGAPWDFRGQDSAQVRTLLTNMKDRYHYGAEGEEARFWLGSFDWLLRLYQHHGLSRASVQREEGICYFETEWEFLRERGCEWLEYVNRHNDTALRIDFPSALRYGSWVSTPRGSMWAVPREVYDVKE